MGAFVSQGTYSCSVWTSIHHSNWTIVWFIFSSNLCFIPLCIPYTKEIRYTRHVHGIFLPLLTFCLLNSLSSYKAFIYYHFLKKMFMTFFFSPAISIPSDGGMSAPSSSHKILFIILSCDLFSCSIVLGTAWPCP